MVDATTPARPVVPDGDPCPVHGEPTDLLFVPGIGLYSQCAECRWDWCRYWVREVYPVTRGDPAALAVGRARPQGELAL